MALAECGAGLDGVVRFDDAELLRARCSRLPHSSDLHWCTIPGGLLVWDGVTVRLIPNRPAYGLPELPVS